MIQQRKHALPLSSAQAPSPETPALDSTLQVIIVISFNMPEIDTCRSSPEFDMPGHAYAAIKSMDARMENMTKIGNYVDAKKYLLSDPNDKSTYLSAQLFKDNAINPCVNSTYAFIEALVKEVKALHSGIQPLKIFHFGGDEVPKGAWTGSPECKNLTGEIGISLSDPSAVKQLMGYFVERVSNITRTHGLDLAAWEDGLLGADEQPYKRSLVMNKNVFANTWDNVWEWKKAARPYKLANAGYKVGCMRLCLGKTNPFVIGV